MDKKIIIPELIESRIKSLASSNTELNHLRAITRYILNRYIVKDEIFEKPVDISVKHFRENTGTGYKKYLDILKYNDIVRCVKNADGKEHYFNHPGSHITGQCKRYYFNPELIFSDPLISSINSKRKRKHSKDPLIKNARQILMRLKVTLSERKLEKYVRNLITYQFIKDRCKINSEIPSGAYYAIVSESDIEVNLTKSKPIPLETLKRIAYNNGLDIIQYHNRKCYLSNSERFIWNRVYQTRENYLNSLGRLKNIHNAQYVNCDRNNTNQRLDTNITTLPSIILPLLRLDNEPLEQADLSNSQFLLFAHVLEKSYEKVRRLDRKHFKENYNISCEKENRDTILYINDKDDNENKLLTEMIDDFTLIYVTKLLANTPKNKPLNHSLSEDYDTFINLTKKGIFYDKVAKLVNASKFAPGAEKVNEWNRDVVKKVMFTAAFSKVGYNSFYGRKIVSDHFPTVFKLMDEYKKLHIQKYLELGNEDPSQLFNIVKDRKIKITKDTTIGDLAKKLGNAQLAVTLQQIESSLFIDKILSKLFERGFKALSRHDSILYKQSDSKAVQAIIRAELDSFFGGDCYTLRIDNF